MNRADIVSSVGPESRFLTPFLVLLGYLNKRTIWAAFIGFTLQMGS